MAIANNDFHTLAAVFGVLGNIVSFLVFMAPIPTFYQIYQRKSTERFPSIPYSVALFSSMLYLYYGFLKSDVIILTINSIGTVLEIIYLTVYMIYATKESKAFTLKLLVLFNAAALGAIIGITGGALHGKVRISAVGWIGAVFSLCVFVAPLSVVRRVIRTKSVEYMPFLLSFFLTMSAVMWFFYGLLINDYFIAGPNVMGFAFGITQMILYVIYKHWKGERLPESKVHDMVMEIKGGEKLEDQESRESDANRELELEIIVTEQAPPAGTGEIHVVEQK